MKSIYKQFLDFKKRHNLSNELISKIANEYANSDLELARTHFSEKYGISQHTFYKARDFAIVFCLVDKKTFYQIRQKSTTNYKNNNEKNSAARALYKKLGYTEAGIVPTVFNGIPGVNLVCLEKTL